MGKVEAYVHWLCRIQGMTGIKIRKLMRTFDTPEEIFRKQGRGAEHIEGIRPEDIMRIADATKERNPETEYQEFLKAGMELIPESSERYPQRLSSLVDRPYCLYLKGRLPDDKRPSVSIVGARGCSEYGRSMAEEFAGELAAKGVQIISGLARGVDGAAHKGALNAGGDTFAVLGCGVDICYPAEHTMMYGEIPEKGGIISEYPPGTKPLSYFFPARNRIISGLSDIVLVIEARERSGSLITADQALEQGRDVFALPGRVTDKLSAGCNRLIKQGAGIALSPMDILEEFHIVYEKNNENCKKIENLLAKDEILVYSCLDLQPKNLDSIRAEIPMDIQDIWNILLNLELRGYIEEISKNHYVIKRVNT